jgi:signal transduction histidine kinase
MKRVSWALRAISLLAAGAGCASCTFIEPSQPPAGTIHLTAAELATSFPGDLRTAPDKVLSTLPSLTWTTVTLPHALPRAVVSGGSDPLQMESMTVWYRMEISAAQVTTQLSDLYLPRWHTWGHLRIYANRELIYSSMEEGIFAAFNDPLQVRLPANLAAAGRPLELLVRMDCVRATGGALSSVWVGPGTALRSMFDKRRMLQNLMPQITSSIFLVLGLFALGLWARRRRETTQLLFFVLSVLFYVRNLHYYIPDPSIPEEWFSWLQVNSVGWLDVVTYSFALRLFGLRNRVFERTLLGAMLAASIATLPLGLVQNNLAVLGPLAYLIFTAVSFAVAVMVTVTSWRVRSAEGAVLAVILWLNLGLGVHDWLLQNWRTDIESIYMLPIGVVALFAMFLATLVRRYAAALSASEKASSVLEAKLSERELELRASYDKLREIEQASLLSQERQRLMREMHDGLGSALMSSLVAVERGQMDSADIVQVLRECVDDLKLTIDSLEPVGDDLLILLATLRYRLEGRLDAAGIKLEWAVNPVPSLPWLNPTLSLHILRSVQEILTNILKHARARTIRLTATHDDTHISIAVEDDGVGFDVDKAAHSGRGLANLRQRAALLNAVLQFASRPGGGTRVCLQLPIIATDCSRS